MSNQSPLTLTDDQAFQKIETETSKLRFILPALVLKLRYRTWLLLLREISILKVLIEHYNQIPPKSFSKTITRLFVKSLTLRKLLSAIEEKLRKRIY